ncbi:MAG: hypothetical protein H0T61_13865 [Actinobacteria bacterium]|nr:hypothetical protein [Actinomycetota bacterium]
MSTLAAIRFFLRRSLPDTRAGVADRHQAERRQHAQARRAAFVVPPSDRTRSRSSTSASSRPARAASGGFGGIADYWSKLELGWHVSTTSNHRDAIETVEQALAETETSTGSRSTTD